MTGFRTLGQQFDFSMQNLLVCQVRHLLATLTAGNRDSRGTDRAVFAGLALAGRTRMSEAATRQSVRVSEWRGCVRSK
jgi:hypothetical protein